MATTPVWGEHYHDILQRDAAREVSDNAAVNARADIARYNGWSLQ